MIPLLYHQLERFIAGRGWLSPLQVFEWVEFRAILAISWFWFLGATFLSLLPALTREMLGGNVSVLTILLAGFSIGIAIGAGASEALNRGKVSANVAPWGALGLAIMAIELWFATQAAIPGGEFAARVAECRETAQTELETPCLTAREFFSLPASWRVLVDFILIAIFAGIYVTPLNAILQIESPDAERGRYIACSNVIDASLIVVSAGLVAVCIALGLRPIDVLALFTITGAIMAVLVARYAPDTRFGRVALALWPRGPQ